MSCSLTEHLSAGAEGVILLKKWLASITLFLFLAPNPFVAVAESTFSQTSAPTISGTAQVGQTLTANEGTWDSGVSFSYQWFRGATPISGATSKTYTLSSADIFSAVNVEISGSKVGYATVSHYSAETSPFITGSYDDIGTTGLSFGVDIASGRDFNCALQTDQTIQCVGRGEGGRLGNGAESNSSDPVAVLGITSAVKVDAGMSHTCALLEDGTIKCWGANGAGQLGDGTTNSASTPVAVSGINDAVDISVGGDSSCAILVDRSVKCWGDNEKYLFANGTQVDSSTPVVVSQLADIRQMDISPYRQCALRLDLSVVCWGMNYWGISETTTYLTTPTLISDFGQAVDISVGAAACAKTVSGTILCWESQTSLNTYNDVRSPGATVANARKMSYGQCAITASGGVQCWAPTDLGLYSATEFTNAYDIDSYGSSSIVVLTEGRAVFGQGTNTYGESGTNSPGTAVTSPQEIIGYGLSLSQTSAPTISGTAQVGQTLTASEGTWDSGVSFSYQWFRGATPISGATSKTYTLSSADLGAIISVKVSGRKVGWFGQTTTSTGTQEIAAAPVVLSPPVAGGGGGGAPVIETIRPGVISSNPLPSGRVTAAVRSDGSVIEVALTRSSNGLQLGLNVGTVAATLQAGTGASFSDEGVLTVSSGSGLVMAASGYQPDSEVSLFLVPTALLTSSSSFFTASTIDLGIATIDAEGELSANLVLAAPAGSYLLQFSGFDTDGEELTVVLETLVAGDQIMKTWTKRLDGNTEAKMYAKNIVGVGKVQFFLNGREIAWVRAVDATDPKLRVITQGPMSGANYLVRTVPLSLGKNVLEIYLDGVRVTRVAYSRK